MTSITHTEARNRIAVLLERLGQYKAAGKIRERDYTYIDLSSGIWADKVTVQINEKLDFFDRAEDDSEVEYRVEINSSTTIRTIAQSVAFVDTFQEAISLAAKVQALVESFPKVLYATEPREDS